MKKVILFVWKGSSINQGQFQKKIRSITTKVTRKVLQEDSKNCTTISEQWTNSSKMTKPVKIWRFMEILFSKLLTTMKRWRTRGSKDQRKIMKIGWQQRRKRSNMLVNLWKWRFLKKSVHKIFKPIREILSSTQSSSILRKLFMIWSTTCCTRKEFLINSWRKELTWSANWSSWSMTMSFLLLMDIARGKIQRSNT